MWESCFFYTAAAFLCGDNFYPFWRWGNSQLQLWERAFFLNRIWDFSCSALCGHCCLTLFSTRFQSSQKGRKTSRETTFFFHGAVLFLWNEVWLCPPKITHFSGERTCPWWHLSKRQYMYVHVCMGVPWCMAPILQPTDETFFWKHSGYFYLLQNDEGDLHFFFLEISWNVEYRTHQNTFWFIISSSGNQFSVHISGSAVGCVHWPRLLRSFQYHAENGGMLFSTCSAAWDLEGDVYPAVISGIKP